MTKEQIINEIKFIIELEGDGGCSSYTSDEKKEMTDFLDSLLASNKSNKTCHNCRSFGDYPKCLKTNSACEDWIPLHKK